MFGMVIRLIKHKLGMIDLPKEGEKWVFIPIDSCSFYKPVEIIYSNQFYVEYKMPSGSLEKQGISSFLMNYEKEKNETNADARTKRPAAIR